MYQSRHREEGHVSRFKAKGTRPSLLISTHGRPRCGRSQSALEGAGTAFYSTALLLYCFCFSVSMGSERGRSGRHCLQSCKLGHGMSLLCKRHTMLPKQRLHIGVERGQALQPHGMAHHFGLLARQPAAAWPCCSRPFPFCQGSQPMLQVYAPVERQGRAPFFQQSFLPVMPAGTPFFSVPGLRERCPLYAS